MRIKESFRGKYLPSFAHERKHGSFHCYKDGDLTIMQFLNSIFYYFDCNHYFSQDQTKIII